MIAVVTRRRHAGPGVEPVDVEGHTRGFGHQACNMGQVHEPGASGHAALHDGQTLLAQIARRISLFERAVGVVLTQDEVERDLGPEAAPERNRGAQQVEMEWLRQSFDEDPLPDSTMAELAPHRTCAPSTHR